MEIMQLQCQVACYAHETEMETNAVLENFGDVQLPRANARQKKEKYQ